MLTHTYYITDTFLLKNNEIPITVFIRALVSLKKIDTVDYFCYIILFFIIYTLTDITAVSVIYNLDEGWHFCSNVKNFIKYHYSYAAVY